jgi:hypothetical protein
MQQSTQPIPLGTTLCRQAVVAFDAENHTSDAGAVLVSRVDRQLGLCARLASAIHDRRHLAFVTHPLSTLLRQRIFQIALGWEDGDDADALRHDPAFMLACGRLPVSGDPLASQPTFSRLENSVDDADLERLRDAILDQYLDKHRNRRKRRLIVLDVDVTDAETHGHQEFSHYNTYYGHTCLTPLLVFDGTTGDLLSVTLRPGNAGPADGLLDELQRLVPVLRRTWPKARILLRADSAFANPGIFAFCDANDLDYLIAMANNVVLDRMAASSLWLAQCLAARDDDQRRAYDAGRYKSGSWQSERRVIWKAEAGPAATDVRFIVTNLLGVPRALYQRYAARGESENWIKAFKRHLNGNRLSCHTATANQFRLYLHAAAYLLLLALSEMLTGTVAERWQFDTLRLRLLKVGGWFQQTAHRITLHLAAAHPHQDLWVLLVRRTMPA